VTGQEDRIGINKNPSLLMHRVPVGESRVIKDRPEARAQSTMLVFGKEKSRRSGTLHDYGRLRACEPWRMSSASAKSEAK
jgi:hypothetical protein